jgi:hypothetical protein
MPGPEQKLLDSRVGRWNVTLRWWKGPDASPLEVPRTSRIKSIMGGRFLQENTTGDFLGRSWEWCGFIAYEKARGLYVQTWIDNLGSRSMRFEGTYDSQAKLFSYTGEGPDLVTGQYVPIRWVEHMDTDNELTVERFVVDQATGKEFKAWELKYTRIATSVETPVTKSTKVPKAFVAGDSVSVGYMAYRMNTAEWLHFVDGMDRPKASYLVIDIAVKNNDRQARTIPSFQLVDERGAEYDSDSGAWRMRRPHIGALDELNPGVVTTGAIVFDVPKEHTYRLKVSGGYWSDATALIEILPTGK